MCIRDRRPPPAPRQSAWTARPSRSSAPQRRRGVARRPGWRRKRCPERRSVSYTHLTLPTICSV
eukprot:12196728-Alexandrium_andersonii.AAC.1